MKKLIGLLAVISILLSACGDNNSEKTATTTPADSSSVNPAADWKFGVALWTFHTVDFADALAKADSAGLKYIEPNTFHKSCPQLKDSLIGQLSASGLDTLKAMAERRGLKIESIYVVGDSTLKSWVKQFEIAKRFGVKFVTTEPPLDMWNSIDSLAGAYGIKVAIHEHWKGVSHYWNPDTTLLAIQGHPNFGASPDLGHFPKSGIDPLDAVKKLSGHIISLHLKDIAAFNNPKLVDVRVGTGIVKFPDIFQELKNQHFNGYIYIERDSTEAPSNLPSVIETVKYYNEQVGKLK